MYGLSHGRAPLGRDGRRALLLATVTLVAASCDVSEDGLRPVLVVPGDAGGGPRDAQIAGQVDAPTGGDLPADAGPPPTIDPPPPDAAAAPPDTTAPLPDAATGDGPIPIFPPGAAAPAVLFVTGDDDLAAGDMVVIGRLRSLGLRVAVREVDDGDSATVAAQQARTFALVVVSSTVPTGTGLAQQLGGRAVPLLCAHAGFFDNLGLSDGEEDEITDDQTALRILTPDHPLADGRRGTVPVVRFPRSFGTTEPVPAAIVIASLEDDEQEVAIFGMEKGAAGAFGPTPARRVGWFALAQTFSSLNRDGWALFDAAIRWLLAPA